MKILLLPRYTRQGASSRLRTLQYIPYLENQGVEITVSSLFDEAYLTSLYTQSKRPKWMVFKCYLRRIYTLMQCYKYDMLWIEKEIFPWIPAFAEALLKLLNIPYVVDYDDAIFHRYDQHHNRVVRLILQNKISKVMRNATLVVVGNNYLENYALQHGCTNVKVIPTVVDLSRYKIRNSKKSDKFNIGWIGTPSTAKYLLTIKSALINLCNIKHARLITVGSGPIEIELTSKEVREWRETSEIQDIEEFDVGIMPLKDEPWEKGKCGYKLIQYMACEKPVIASPVGVNIEIVENDVTGYLARNEEEWKQALNTLMSDPELCKSMGKAGRRKVEQYYSLEKTAPVLYETFRKIIKPKYIKAIS